MSPRKRTTTVLIETHETIIIRFGAIESLDEQDAVPIDDVLAFGETHPLTAADLATMLEREKEDDQ